MVTFRGTALVARVTRLALLVCLACQGTGGAVDARDITADRGEIADILGGIDPAEATYDLGEFDATTCNPACPAGTRCVDGECCPCPDIECGDGAHAEWIDESWVCVDDPCDAPCTNSQHCEDGSCVDNTCTGDVTNAECEALGCLCLDDGSCGECNDCVPPCPVGDTCVIENGVPTCVLLDDCGGCTPYEHCVGPGVCIPNVCDPPCDDGGYCEVDGGNGLFDCYASECGPCDGYCAAPGVCVPWPCDPPCPDYEQCDENLTCQPNLCEPGCELSMHCTADGVCVPNGCDPPECPNGCDQFDYCIPDPCVDCGIEGPAVCALVDSADAAFQTFDNLCLAACAPGFVAVAACDQYPVDPVCDVAGYTADPAGDHTYDNVCFAQCTGATELAHGACDCSMTCTEAELGGGPVCGVDCSDYQNPCAAKCAGVGVQYPHACPIGCGCENECAYDGLKQCQCAAADDVECNKMTATRTCGHIDEDDCLEWGPTIPCGAEDKCVNGTCVPDVIPIDECMESADCDDGDQCTVDTCNKPLTTCHHALVLCDDGESCTTDYCNWQQGCLHPPMIDGQGCVLAGGGGGTCCEGVCQSAGVACH